MNFGMVTACGGMMGDGMMGYGGRRGMTGYGAAWPAYGGIHGATGDDQRHDGCAMYGGMMGGGGAAEARKKGVDAQSKDRAEGSRRGGKKAKKAKASVRSTTPTTTSSR